MADKLAKNIDENLFDYHYGCTKRRFFFKTLKQIDSWLKLSDIRDQKLNWNSRFVHKQTSIPMNDLDNGDWILNSVSICLKLVTSGYP